MTPFDLNAILVKTARDWFHPFGSVDGITRHHQRQTRRGDHWPAASVTAVDRRVSIITNVAAAFARAIAAEAPLISSSDGLGGT